MLNVQHVNKSLNRIKNIGCLSATTVLHNCFSILSFSVIFENGVLIYLITIGNNLKIIKMSLYTNFLNKNYKLTIGWLQSN